MTRALVTEAFREFGAPHLRSVGFVGRGGHFVRRQGAVTQVVELQHSVYGGRVTVNLGLGLEWLRPHIRWIRAPQLGPHAHDCTRWIRLGLVSPARADTWWSFGEDEDRLVDAVQAMSGTLIDHGLPWLEEYSARESFLRYAHDKLERSRSPHRPRGSFLELRLMAAICAWCGDTRTAKRHAQAAAKLWPTESDRLQQARETYLRKHSSDKAALPGVPELLDELRGLIEPEGEDAFDAAQAAAELRRKD